MTSMLDQLFPGTEPGSRVPGLQGRGSTGLDGARWEAGMSETEHVKTRWAAIYALEIRGEDKKEIAARLGLSYTSVIHITNSPRYIAYREEHLQALDHDFVAMKPLAFDALKQGLRSADENTALRASEQWFKAASFGGFSKQEAPSSTLTAEDVVQKLLQQVNVQVNVPVQVNVQPAGEAEVE